MPDEAIKKRFLRSGQLAAAAGVSRDTLRHYEKKGVLPRPLRSPAGYRLYPVQAIGRVQLIRRAIQIGFTLDELAQILQVRDKDGAPCHEVRRLAAAKLDEVETLLEGLISMRDTLRSLLQDWDERLAKTDAGQRAALLESLAGDHPAGGETPPHASNWRRRKKRG